MKSLSHIPLILLFSSLVFITACSTEPVTPEGSTMIAKVDGVEWNAEMITEVFYQSNQIQLKGVAQDGSSIQILLLGVNGARDYSVGPSSSGNIAIYRINEAQQWTTDPSLPTGRVDLSALSEDEVRGTFYFSATDGTTTKNISEGKFDIKFQQGG